MKTTSAYIPIHLATESSIPSTAADSGISDVLTHFDSLCAALPDDLFAVECKTVSVFLALAGSLDAQFGADAELPVEDTDVAVEDALDALSLIRLKFINQPEQHSHSAHRLLDTITINCSLWAMRHVVALNRTSAISEVVNALSERANAATSRQDAAAVVGLMQGFIMHLEPRFAADLERSNPARPWRILNLNFAIAAIRTGDLLILDFAFKQLNRALPDECVGFYSEASDLAIQSGLPAEIQQRIAAEHSKYSTYN